MWLEDNQELKAKCRMNGTRLSETEEAKKLRQAQNDLLAVAKRGHVQMHAEPRIAAGRKLDVAISQFQDNFTGESQTLSLVKTSC